MKKTLLALSLFALTSTAQAADPYKQGFVEGIAYQRQACLDRSTRQVHYLASENKYLKKQMLAMQQQLARLDAEGASGADTEYLAHLRRERARDMD